MVKQRTLGIEYHLKRKKVFVLGLDGATLDLIQPWIEAGDLPNFARLVEEGCVGELETVVPPVTAPAWSSFMTGKNPGKHGLWSCMDATHPMCDLQEHEQYRTAMLKLYQQIDDILGRTREELGEF